MFESTATWSEEKVFDGVNDYLLYLDSWAEEPDEPITSAGDGVAQLRRPEDVRLGDLEPLARGAATAPEVVRRAWAISQDNSVAGGGFAPRAYDQAIRQEGGAGLRDRARRLRRRHRRVGRGRTAGSARDPRSRSEVLTRSGTLTPGGAAATGVVDHTAFALFDVPVPTGAADLHLTGGLPAGTAGAIALVGFDGDERRPAWSGSSTPTGA